MSRRGAEVNNGRAASDNTSLLSDSELLELVVEAALAAKPDLDKSKATEYYSSVMSDLGRSHFELRFGLREPKNPFEVL